MSKEGFKEFVKKNTNLINYVENGKTDWQHLYELYDLYGENSNIWEKYQIKNSKTNSEATKENSNQKIINRESANNASNKKSFMKRAKNNGKHIVDTRNVLTVDSFVFTTPSSRKRIQSNKIKYNESNQSKNGWNDKNALKLKDYLKENKKLLDEGWID